MSEMTSGCPSEEILGAFLDGQLAGVEREAVVAHLATCDRCIGGAEFVTRTKEGRQPANVVAIASSRRARAWMSIAAAVALVVFGAAFVEQWRSRHQPGIETLIAAAPADYRTVEPRLAGFPWHALQRLRDEQPAQDPETLRLGGAAGDVLVRAQRDRSAEALHAAGVADLLLQRSSDAIERLRTAAESEKTAAAWSDLAAAYYSSAVRDGRTSDLPRALAAADRAIAIDAAFSEARFNRALILERMGLRSEAAAAWRDYLARDPGSPWAAEARAHADALPPATTTSTRSRMERLERIAAAGNAAAVDTMVRADAGDARNWFETDVLVRWGDAATRGDASAAMLLAAARQVGASLQRASGESMLADAVAVIDAADASRRLTLARAFGAYGRGLQLYRERHLEEATEAAFEAARGFDEAKSPMADAARFFAARTLFDENRVGDAARLLSKIAPRPHHDAMRAQVALRLARCHEYGGRWEEAERGFAEAARVFTALHETGNAAFAEANLGDTLDELGAFDEAWKHRIAALTRHEDRLRIVATLAAAVRSELKAEEVDAAHSLLAIEIHETAALGEASLQADALRRRALIDSRLGDDAAAAESLARCRALIARTPPSGLRERLSVETTLAEAATIQRRDPQRAIALLTSSMPFLTRADHRIFLPDALLERGRAERAAGHDAEALAAFRTGLDEIEAQRRTAPSGSAIFDAATPLVEETVALQLARGDAAGAFDTMERTHARALLDGSNAPPATAREVAAALPPGTMLVAYALVPDGVAAICVTRNGAESAQQKIARAELAEDARRLRSAVAARADVEVVKRRAAALDALLLARLPRIDSAASLVVIPDRLLYAVPWAALFDPSRGTFAVEDHAITLAPSAALYLARRTVASPAGGRVLIVKGAARGLDAHADEAAGYAGEVTLAGAEATPARFFALAADAKVVHFAGHARPGAEPALLLADGGELPAAEIARGHFAPSSLVVLAACGTAAGDGNGFDGPRGLAQAFLTAGAGAVVGTLWPVDDAEAAELFAEFHRRLHAGEEAASALRHAQLTLLRGGNARSRQPAAWAAAELFGGDWRIGGNHG
jgi:CHAT domain-containing protein